MLEKELKNLTISSHEDYFTSPALVFKNILQLISYAACSTRFLSAPADFAAYFSRESQLVLINFTVN